MRFRPVFAVPIVTVTLVVSAASLAAQTGTGAIRATVRHAATNTPLANVQVSLAESRIGGVTRDDGTLVIPRVTPGPQRVQARLIGYSPMDKMVTVRAGDTASVEFAIVPAAVTLE